ncbi:immunoglobulin superfamily member 11-like isoform X2 [Ascaphus truei]|uniref:immunoglobulin superfamily member 11-like isoform X2 n=1 Tax=Ascaphus truei TaxID=8439 RepID=UPI003F5A8954
MLTGTAMCQNLSLAQLWLLLHCFIPAVGTVKVTVGTPSVQVTRGRSALLPCGFRTTAALNRLNIIWTVSPLVEPRHPLQVISYEQGQIVESLSEYLGRVGFAFQPSKDASIFINQTRSSDTGTYQCTVVNPPDGATPNIGLIGLTVLVPLSSPECSSKGQGQEGGSIRLLCSVREGVPAPTFTWEKIAPDSQMLIISQEDHHASVTLNNLTIETSGLYRCTVTNQLGSRTCALELHVQVVQGTMGIITGITITLIMGLVLLALFALVLCFHQQSRGKWREREDESYRQVSVDNLSPIRLSVTKNPCRDAGICRPAKPLRVLSSQVGEPSTYILQDGRQIHLSSTATLEAPNFRPARSTMPLSSEMSPLSESGEEDLWFQAQNDVYTGNQPASVLRVSLYPTNSGFLV